MANRSVRVLLAEDSPTVRHYLVRMINAAPGLQVVGEARDGLEAVEMAEKLKPDVISMDIRMPVMDGLEATRQIMARCPTPIVMVSAVLEEEIDLSFQAIQAGALAVVPKPPAQTDASFNAQQRQLLGLLIAMAEVSVVRRRESLSIVSSHGSVTITQEVRAALKPPPPRPVTKNLRAPIELLAIGASAGGPSALSIFLSCLPADFAVPIVIVQHLPDEFIPGLARWLDDATPLAVKVVEDGEILKTGGVYLSPGKAHLTVARQGEKLMARLLKEQGGYRYRPSVDVLFQSVSVACGAKGGGIILTGMGEDGAEGLLALRQAGGQTFAQDQESCTVFGMPAAAIERGAVEHILGLRQLPVEVLRFI